MTDPATILNPRVLYAMLRACPTPETRATAALEFLRGASGAESGFLFLRHGDQLALAAGASQPPPEGLVQEAERQWREQLNAPAEDFRTLDVGEIQPLLAMENALFHSAAGAFEHRLLSCDRSGERALVGIAMLKTQSGRTLRPVRHAQLQALSNALIDSERADALNSKPPRA